MVLNFVGTEQYFEDLIKSLSTWDKFRNTNNNLESSERVCLLSRHNYTKFGELLYFQEVLLVLEVVVHYSICIGYFIFII